MTQSTIAQTAPKSTYLIHIKSRIFETQCEMASLGEAQQFIDNISRALPSGPWLLRLQRPGEWAIERIDCVMVGYVTQKEST